MKLFENIKITDEQLQPIVDWCEKNKDFPTIRVNVNGQLVDEFVCDNEQSIEVSERVIENKCNGSKYLKHRIDRIDHHKFLIPKKCRVIELDTSSWSTEGEISINVSNNKSNYNNGFMSKRSMVSLEPVFLISKDMYHDRNSLYRIFKKNTGVSPKEFIQRKDND